MNKILHIIFFVLLFVSANAQPFPKNPYECVENHLDNTSHHNYSPKKAAMSFKTNKLSQSTDLAVKLKLAYDGLGIFVSLDKIPSNPDYIDSTSKLNRFYILPERLPEIYVEKIGNRWVYSPECYDDIIKLYKKTYPFGSDLLYDNIPRFDNARLFSIYYWQYLSLIILVIFSVIGYFILKSILRPTLSFIVDKLFNKHVEIPLKFTLASKILSLIILIFTSKYAVALIRLPISVSSFLVTFLNIALAILVGVLVYRLFDIIMSYLGQYAKTTKSKMDDQYVPIISQVIKAVITIFVLFKVLVLLGVDVTAIIAGLSIGGLAIALASQDTVKNFIGSLMIFWDKPFKVDDWIEIDKFSGAVKEVGFRSTRIQQLDTSVISIPNSLISNQALTNKGERNFRMFETILNISFDTPRPTIEAFLTGLRKIADEHSKIYANYNINLINIGETSYKLLVRIYFITNDYIEELKLKEELTFYIIELAEMLDIHFAVPSQIFYFRKKQMHAYNSDSNSTDINEKYKKLNEFFEKNKFENQNLEEEI